MHFALALAPCFGTDRTWQHSGNAVRLRSLTVRPQQATLEAVTLSLFAFPTSLGAHVELFDVLVENGAQINYQSSEVGEQSALHLAAESGRLGFAKKLLHSGADPELKDRNGKRAIELASQNGNDRAKLALQGPRTGARLCYGSRADGSGQMCCFRWRPRSADVVRCMNDVVACVGEIVPVQAVPSKPTAEPTGKSNLKPAKPTAAPTVKLTPKPATVARTTEPSDARSSGATSKVAAAAAGSAADLASLTHATFHMKCADRVICDSCALRRAARLRCGGSCRQVGSDRPHRYRDTAPVLLRDSKHRWKALDSWSTKEKFDELFGEYDVSTRVAM